MAVGEYAINVEDEHLDSARTVFRGKSHGIMIRGAIGDPVQAGAGQPARPYSLTPVAFDPDPAAVTLDPVSWNPACARTRRLDVVTWHPDVSAAIPAVEAWHPHPARMSDWPWGNDFNRTRWRRADAYDDLGLPCGTSEKSYKCCGKEVLLHLRCLLRVLPHGYDADSRWKLRIAAYVNVRRGFESWGAVTVSMPVRRKAEECGYCSGEETSFARTGI